MNAPVLTTNRLILRPLELADAADIQRRFPRWDIVKFMDPTVPWPYPDDGALIYLQNIALPAMQAGIEWHWSIRLNTNPDELIGVVSLNARQDDNRGFWLAEEFQGQGIMTEASDAATDYWFDILGNPRLCVAKAVSNVASRRISERQGMRIVWTGDRGYVSGVVPAEVWEISAEKWRSRRRG